MMGQGNYSGETTWYCPPAKYLQIGKSAPLQMDANLRPVRMRVVRWPQREPKICWDDVPPKLSGSRPPSMSTMVLTVIMEEAYPLLSLPWWPSYLDYLLSREEAFQRQVDKGGRAVVVPVTAGLAAWALERCRATSTHPGATGKKWIAKSWDKIWYLIMSVATHPVMAAALQAQGKDMGFRVEGRHFVLTK